MAKVVLSDVCKVYGGKVKAVKEFSLEIKDGEFVVLVGPSGCGKSTTLRMIAGLEEITSGKIYIGDRMVNDLEPKDRNIAMVFQNYALYPHMSVYDNLGYSLRCFGEKKDVIEKKVHEVAKMLDIEEFLDRKPKELSGGQRQRVALGRCLIRDPEVFLFDEPLSNLDAKLRVQMRSEISRLHQRIGGTFVYVTHDQTEAMTMGDRIVVMKDGLIQQVDTPENLYEHPANTFVATFLGSPQMNLFEARLEGGKALLGGEGEDPLALDLLPETFLKMEHYEEGQKAIVGIRPSDFSLGNEKERDVLVEKLDLVEKLGNETLLYFQLPGRKEATLASLRLQMSDRLEEHPSLKIERSHIHLFSPKDGVSLSRLRDHALVPVRVERRKGEAFVDGSPYPHFEERLLSEAPEGSFGATLSLPMDAIHLEEGEGRLARKARVEAIDQYSGYQAVYLLLEDGTRLTMRAPEGGPLLKKGEERTVYLDAGKGSLIVEGKTITGSVPLPHPLVEASFRLIGKSPFLFLPDKELSRRKHYKIIAIEDLRDEGRMALALEDDKGHPLGVMIPREESLYVGEILFAKLKK